MIPLGVLASARVAASGGTGARTFVGAYSNETDQSVYTFSVPVGAGSKTIIVAGTGRLNAAHSMSGVTVGGDALTIDAFYNLANQGNVFVGHVTKSCAASENISLTFTADLLRCGIGVWTVDGAVTVADTFSVRYGGALGPSQTFDLDAADHVICYTTSSGGNAPTWTGAAQRFNVPSGTSSYWHQSGADGETANPSVSKTGYAVPEDLYAGVSYNNA